MKMTIFTFLFLLSCQCAVAQDTEIYPADKIDSSPEFPGGVKAFYKYISNNLVLPEVESNLDVKVHITFVVEKDGTMTNIKATDPGYGLGMEAQRVLGQIKEKWRPGILAGNPVRASYSIPISIKIKVDKKPDDN